MLIIKDFKNVKSIELVKIVESIDLLNKDLFNVNTKDYKNVNYDDNNILLNEINAITLAIRQSIRKIIISREATELNNEIINAIEIIEGKEVSYYFEIYKNKTDELNENLNKYKEVKRKMNKNNNYEIIEVFNTSNKKRF